MASNNKFDETISTWLEDTAPTGLPQRVLAATFERTRRSRQQLGWRGVLGRRQMPRFVPALGAAAVVVMAAVLALNLIPMSGPGGPTTQPPTASPTPSSSPVTPPPSPFTERFDSAVHGVSISYPSGWQTRPATEPWNHETVAFGASEVDVIFDPTFQADLYIALVSEPLRGLSGEEWVNGLDAAVEICGEREEGAGSTGGSYTLDGAKGWAVSRVRGAQPAGCQFVAVATATRGYIIVLHVGDERHPEAYGWGWFKSVLETVNLRPEDAVDALSPAASP